MKAETIASSARRVLLPAMLVIAGCQGPAEPASQPVPPTQPMARDTPPPAYPPELACANVGGQVLLTLVITPEGRTSDVRVQRGSGVGQLDELAAEAVRGWTFAPATVGGQPVARRIQVPVNFRPPTVRPESCFALDERRQDS